MSRSKENYFNPQKSHFIRYLYQEGQRQGVDKNPNFYSELIKFVNTPEGQASFEQFKSIDPYRLGICVQSTPQIINRAFKL
jgi:hypothetical protein